ncbi:diacylglycerol kinase family protein [Halobacillus halophilus]|uniref:diacylglycerol kinase family protein n=1 Tax=Halobacillus halophilus TaxID=1570 RepID=UPI001CD1E86B|nr:diacylglycerol kinase family protein [Halobacillus halophilus]MCA1009717.1 diacylglycerol kinase family protein [Halobacillus halophilus]
MSSDLKGPKKKKSIGFRFAWNGVKEVWSAERNFRIHLIAGVLCIATGASLRISTLEWALLIIMITIVITLEMINSSIERVMDYLAPQYHPLAGLVKDIAAGAVLIASIASLIVGAFIFLPHLITLF